MLINNLCEAKGYKKPHRFDKIDLLITYLKTKMLQSTEQSLLYATFCIKLFMTATFYAFIE